jgi:hypothetical protein
MNDLDLTKKDEVIEGLKNLSEVFCKHNVNIWVKGQEKYEINIFTVLLDNNEQLNNCWEELTNDIAVHFQSLLDKDIEIWNIYVLFLIKEVVDKDLKYKIEQDKYSSRKIVCDDFKAIMGESLDLQIKSIIDNKLFGFQLNELKNDRNETTMQISIEEMVRQTDTKLYQIIKYVSKNINAKPEKLFDIYME